MIVGERIRKMVQDLDLAFDGKEIKLTITALKKLRDTKNWEDCIDSYLKKLEELARRVDAYNDDQIQQLDKTKDWYQQELDWTHNRKKHLYDELLDKMIESKIKKENDEKITFWRILVVPWPPHAENLNIPIGISRFLSLPGSHGLHQNSKKLKVSGQIALFHSKISCSASGAEKNAPERYVYVGFWAGAANVDFWSPRCVFGAQNHKRWYFIGFHRLL